MHQDTKWIIQAIEEVAETAVSSAESCGNNGYVSEKRPDACCRTVYHQAVPVGISHSRAEFTKSEDIEAGYLILTDYLKEPA